MSEGKLNLKPHITHRISLSECNAMLEKMRAAGADIFVAASIFAKGISLNEGISRLRENIK